MGGELSRAKKKREEIRHFLWLAQVQEMGLLPQVFNRR